jgi:hypothetical protein
VLLASDVIWSCTFLHVGVSLAVAFVLLFLLTFIRKLAARLVTGGTGNATQLTFPQKMFLLGMVLISVGLVLAPGVKALAVVEIALWCSVLAEGWVHFVAFERTSNDVLGQVVGFRAQSAPSAAPQPPTVSPSVPRVMSSLKHLRRSKRNIGRNVRMMFVLCHTIFGCVLLCSSLLPANGFYYGECQVPLVLCCLLNYTPVLSQLNYPFAHTPFLVNIVFLPVKIRLGDDSLSAVKSLRFYLHELMVFFGIALCWHSVYVFTAAKRRKMYRNKAAKQQATNLSAPSTGGYMNESTQSS